MLAIADIAVPVKDARAAAQWWAEKFGCEVHTVGAPGGHAIMVAPPGERFLLHLCEGIEPVDPGNTGIAFMTDDIEGLVRRLESANIRFPEPLVRRDWGGSAKFADPDGNVFWLLGAPTKFIRSELQRRAGNTRPARTAAVRATPSARGRTRSHRGRRTRSTSPSPSSRADSGT